MYAQQEPPCLVTLFLPGVFIFMPRLFHLSPGDFLIRGNSGEERVQNKNENCMCALARGHFSPARITSIQRDTADGAKVEF